MLLLLVRTTLHASPIHGIALFAEEEIASGMVVWHFAHGFDQRLDDTSLAQLSDAACKQVLGYASIDSTTDERLLLGTPRPQTEVSLSAFSRQDRGPAGTSPANLL